MLFQIRPFCAEKLALMQFPFQIIDLLLLTLVFQSHAFVLIQLWLHVHPHTLENN